MPDIYTTTKKAGGRPPCNRNHAARYRAALRIILDRHDGNRKRAGEALGLSEMSISKHLRGLMGPSPATIARAASLLGLTRDALLAMTVEQIEALGATAKEAT